MEKKDVMENLVHLAEDVALAVVVAASVYALTLFLAVVFVSSQ